MLAVLLK